MHSDPYATGIVPPQAVEAERYVLGALLLEPRQCADVVTTLEPGSFYDPKHEAIYQVLSQMFDTGTPIDLFTVGQQLQKSGQLQRVGGPTYLAELTQVVGSASHVAAHAQVVREKQIARQLMQVGREITSQVVDATQDLDDILQYASTQVDKINSLAVGGRMGYQIGESLKNAMNAAERRAALASSGKPTGITTGLQGLDKLTGGWQGSQLIVLAARPAMGKTAIALHFAKSAAQTGTPVAIYSLEMSDISLADRLLLSACGVEAEAFRAGRLSSDDWKALELANGELTKLPIWIDDTASTSMQRIKVHSRVLAKKGLCGMVIIDYLQLVDVSTKERNRNREQEIAQASRQAKILAKELSVPVILLSQLSRNVEARADKKPILADLRESGAIEQDADIVAFIHRPAYYGIATVPTRYHGETSTEGMGIISIAKQRNGAIGDIPFRHNPAMTKITDWEPAKEEADKTNLPF